jgi:hypothetical protein
MKSPDELAIYVQAMIGNLDFAMSNGVTKDHAKLLIWQTKEMLLTMQDELKGVSNGKKEGN